MFDNDLSQEKIDQISKKIKELYKNNENLFKESVYYDYRDEIDISDVVKAKNKDQLTDIYLDHLIDSGTIWNLENYVLSEVLNELNINLEDYDNGYVIEDLIRDYIQIDDNLDELFKQSEIYVNLMPYQQENANTEGTELMYDLENIMSNINSEKIIFNDDEIKSEILHKLFSSQGYQINDLIDKKKVDSSKFLKSFKNELNNYYTNTPAFIVFLTQLDINDYYDLKSGEKDLIFEEGVCGIFDPVTGSGSILEIELEKPFDISFDKDDDFNLVQVEGFSEYGYSVNEVYGLIQSAWTDSKTKIKDHTTTKEKEIKIENKGKVR